MGRKAVIEINCDRCGKVEHLEHNQSSGQAPSEPVFVGVFEGKRVEYRDMCSNCKPVVKAHWTEITKSMQKVSPTRDRTQKSAPVAAPTQPTTPPKAPVSSGQKLESHGSSQRS